MCSPICRSKPPLPPVYDENNIDLRNFKKHPISNGKGEVVNYLNRTYDAKVTVTNNRYWDFKRMRELAETILNNVQSDIPVYTHFWYLRYTSITNFRSDDGTGVENSEPFRLIRKNDGTFVCYKVSWDRYRQGDQEEADLVRNDYLKIKLNFFYGSHSRLLRSKKSEKELKKIYLKDCG